MVTRYHAAIAWVFVALPSVVMADAGEASLVAHAFGGSAALGDPALESGTDTVSLAGVAARITYATHDTFAYETSVSVARTSQARFEDVMHEGRQGVLSRDNYLARVDSGIRLRMGVDYIPTVHLAVGVQAHAARRARFTTMAGNTAYGPPGSIRWAAVVSAGLGFDHRINARWTAGVSIVTTSALASDTVGQRLEGGVHISYSWYPR